MLLWLLLLPLVAASPIQTISVGQILNLTLSARATVTVPLEKGLPKWLLFNNGHLVGIPTINDVGSLTLQIKTPGTAERTIILRVLEDDSNPCASMVTTWVEVIYSKNAGLAERIDAAKDVADKISVDLNSIRVLDFDYSRKFREIEDLSKVEESGSFAVIKPYCDGDLDAVEQATDDMDKLLDDDESFESSNDDYQVTITQGKVLNRKLRNEGENVLSGMEFNTNEPETATKSSARTTTQRSTRQSGDNPPVRLNSLSGFTCTAGVLCETIVPEQTFKDAEDGDTYKLQLTVILLDQEGDNFLLFSYKDHKLQGVPLKAGEYQFRLEARDKRGQMTSAPFSVSVKESPPSNHLVTFHMDLVKTLDMETNPELLTDFTRKFAQVTRSKPESITVRDITKEGDRTLVSWSNNSLPYKTCSEKGIENMMAPMLTKRRNMMNRQFETAMTARFNLRKVEYILLGNCLKEEDPLATTAPTVEATSQSTFPWIYLILALLLVLLLVICLVIVCAKKKNNKKGTKPSDAAYVGKGLPVVFPEEVPDDHELAHATTPMLTKEERPPLKVSQHENPLYRPPPPLVSASPRIGSTAGSLPPTQTFARQPPPYVPP